MRTLNHKLSLDNLEMERASGWSLSDEALYRNSSKALFSEKTDRGENLVERLVPPLVLNKAEIEVVRQRRECVDSFVHLYRQKSCREPNDVEIARHLECKWESNTVSWISID